MLCAGRQRTLRGMRTLLLAATLALTTLLPTTARPASASPDPGVHSSIVDVRALADRWPERRTFVARGIGSQVVDLVLGGVAVQFWSRDCREVGNLGEPMRGIEGRVQFTIPPTAAWMTVASVDSAPLRWRIR